MLANTPAPCNAVEEPAGTIGAKMVGERGVGFQYGDYTGSKTPGGFRDESERTWATLHSSSRLDACMVLLPRPRAPVSTRAYPLHLYRMSSVDLEIPE